MKVIWTLIWFIWCLLFLKTLLVSKAPQQYFRETQTVVLGRAWLWLGLPVCKASWRILAFTVRWGSVKESYMRGGNFDIPKCLEKDKQHLVPPAVKPLRWSLCGWSWIPQYLPKIGRSLFYVFVYPCTDAAGVGLGTEREFRGIISLSMCPDHLNVFP